jgi:hypothetical protein
MVRKKYALLFIFLLVLMSVLPNTFAAFSDTLDRFDNVMDFFYGAVASVTTAEVLQTERGRLGALRFLFALGVFAVVYAGTSKIPAFNNRTAATLALVVAAFVLLIDPKVIFSLGKIYIVFLILIIVGGPTFAIIYLSFAVPPRGRGFTFLKILLNIAAIFLVLYLGDVLRFAIETYADVSGVVGI